MLHKLVRRQFVVSCWLCNGRCTVALQTADPLQYYNRSLSTYVVVMPGSSSAAWFDENHPKKLQIGAKSADIIGCWWPPLLTRTYQNVP